MGLSKGDEMRHGQRWVVVMLVAATSALGACGSDGEDDREEVTQEHGALRIMVDVADAGEVRQAELSVVSCDGRVEVERRLATVEEWTHEAMKPAYVVEPDHLFFEHYLGLGAGCYDVEVSFVGAGGAPTSCAVARGRSVQVEAGKTQEILLFGRCGHGEEPAVEMIQFFPGSFLGCVESVEVCATVRHTGSVKGSWSYHQGAPLPTSPTAGGELELAGDHHQRICSQWQPEYHGETVGRLTVAPGWSELVEGGRAALNAPVDEVLFSLFVECPDKKFKEGGPFLPPGVERDDFRKVPKYPKLIKPPKWFDPPGDEKDPKEEEEERKSQLKVLAALNHPPSFTSVTHDPNKFVSCPAEVTICVTAEDPDKDPILFQWAQLQGPPPVTGPVQVSHDQADGVAHHCVHYTFADKGATYLFEVTAMDLFYDDQGQLVTAETWFEEQGLEGISSRATLEVPVHVGCKAK